MRCGHCGRAVRQLFIRPTSGGGAAVGLSVGLRGRLRRVYHALFLPEFFVFDVAEPGWVSNTAFAAL